jgi:hypothetical protein
LILFGLSDVCRFDSELLWRLHATVLLIADEVIE